MTSPTATPTATPVPSPSMRFISIQGLNAITWTFTTLSILLTIGRFHLHWRRNGRFDWADHFNGLAALFLLGFAITYQLVIGLEYQTRAYEVGLSDWLPPEADLVRGMRIQIANLLLFFLVIYCVKASFLALYWKIFSISKGFRRAWWGVLVYTVLSFFVSWLATFWGCGSPEKTASIDGCKSEVKTEAVNTLILWCVLNVVGDVLLMVLPLCMLRSLPLMSLGQKFGLAFCFSLVLVSITFNICRTLYSITINPEYRDQNVIWTVLEPTTVIIVCALPCYRGVLSPGRCAMSTISNTFSGFTGSFWRKSGTSGESGCEVREMVERQSNVEKGLRSHESEEVLVVPSAT